MADLKSFANCISAKIKGVNERSLAFLFYRAQMSDIPEAGISELRADFRSVGLPIPNHTRLKYFLSKDRRTVKVGADKWRIRTDKMDELRIGFGSCLGKQKQKIVETNSVIPNELVEKTRHYIEEVVRQINGSYDIGYFDACGVMIRRLVETLLIETFESHKIQNKIKDNDGNYFMFEKLINCTLRESKMTLGRNAKKGLLDAKWLGDQSAHNRRFLAKQSDIDRIQPNIRILVQELVTLAGLQSK